MGFGDKLLAVGDAYDLYQTDNRHRKVAIGNGARIDWCPLSEGLHFLATQTQVDAGKEVHWVISYPSHRPYIRYDEMRKAANAMGMRDLKQRHLSSALGHYIWNYNYKAKPARVAFDSAQSEVIHQWSKEPFICVEPFIKDKAPPNKQWPLDRFGAVIKLMSQHIRVVQLSPPERETNFPGATRVTPNSFKDALAYIKASKLYIGPEGGLHHGAAATDTPAVVLFGGYVPPAVTGYDSHTNLVGDNDRFCGRKTECPHCLAVMDSILPSDVLEAAHRILGA